MEGVGARLGRSSSRYGTTTVFTGPVRRWKKKWVHVPPRANPNNASTAASSASNQQSPSLANGVSGNGTGNASSRLVLYRWTPISKKNGENENPNSKEEDLDLASADEPPPRRKFRYVPVAALEEEIKVTEENTDDEAKLADAEDDANVEEPNSKIDAHNEKPDINDVPMEENEASEERQDLNVSTLDLSLGFTSREGEQGSDLNMEPADEE